MAGLMDNQMKGIRPGRHGVSGPALFRWQNRFKELKAQQEAIKWRIMMSSSSAPGAAA